MTWYDIAGIVLLIVFAVPVIALLIQMGRFLWGGIHYARQPKKPELTAETEFGTFVRNRGTAEEAVWTGSIGELSVQADDVGDAPDPKLLRRLPKLLPRIAEFEQIARKEVDGLDERHVLEGIMSGDEGSDFVLSFACDEEEGDESVFVGFKGTRVVDSITID